MIAILLVALIAAPAAGAATPSRAPSVPTRQLRAGETAPTSLATEIIKQLVFGAAAKTGGVGLGYVLDSFGLGGGEVDAQELADIRSELQSIQRTVDATLAATNEVKVEVTRGTYSLASQMAIKFTGPVNEGMNRLDRIAKMSPDEPTKQSYSEEMQAFIHEKLMNGEQVEFAEQIEGQGAGDGLLVTASKAAAASPYWTLHTSNEMEKLFEYYQGEEARMLMLRVEYMNTKPGTYSEKTISEAIEATEKRLASQRQLLKPPVPKGMIADTRNGLLYDMRESNQKYDAGQAGYRDWKVDTAPTCREDCWKLATYDQMAQLVNGWPGGANANWALWLDQQTKEAIYQLKAVHGVWTYAVLCQYEDFQHGNLCLAKIFSPSGVDQQITPEIIFRDEPDYGFVLVRPRPLSYWW